MNESSRKERWIQISMYSQESCCFWKVGEASHASKPMKKNWRSHWGSCRKNIQQRSLCAHVFRLHFGTHIDFMSFLTRLYACGSSRVSFAIICLGTCLRSFELVEGMEELYFGADQVSIPDSDDSAGRAQYYVESYVYEPEEPVNSPGLGENSEATSAESSTAQMPILPGCFITASGTCVHSSGCHHGKRAEVQKIPVRFCECFSESGFRHLPHTTEVFLDFRDFLHQSRFCEAFSRRHHPLSQMAVKRIVKKCRHCFWAQISAGRLGVGKRDVFLSVVQVAVCMYFWEVVILFQIFACLWLKVFFVSFALIVSHLKWKNVWNSWYQHGFVRTGRCSASTGHWKCFSWRGRWRRVSSWGRRCGLDPVLRTKSYDRGWVSFWRSFPCGSQSCCHRTSTASTWKYCRCL